MSMQTRVLIYETSNLQCELLSTGLASLAEGLEVRCVKDFEGANTLLAAEPHWVVVISDSSLNDSTVSFTKLLHTRYPVAPLVFLVQEGRQDYLMNAFRLGARGIVYSNEGLAQLGQCIHSVAEGELWVRHLDLSTALDELSKPIGRLTDSSGKKLLSAREEEVSRLVSEGMSNRDVSRALHISESTVKNVLFHVFDKLGISNRVELARYVNSGTGSSSS